VILEQGTFQHRSQQPAIISYFGVLDDGVGTNDASFADLGVAA
jgi:hypothetical protein